MDPIRVLATVDSGVDPEVVQTLLSIEPAVQIIGMAESLDAAVDPAAERSADVHLVACEGHSDRVLSFIGGSAKQHPDRPIVILSEDAGNGFVRRVIEAGADDIVTVGMLDSLSLKNTKLGLETLGLMGVNPEQVKLVLNRADSRVGITRDDVTGIVGRAPDIMVPSHRDIARLVNEGRPVVEASPRSEAAKAFSSLAALYSGEGATAASSNGRRPRQLLRRKR